MAVAPPFESFAHNDEDVVLWRVLAGAGVDKGRYIDVGANSANRPTDVSVSRAFYDRGWRGIVIEPVPGCAESLGQQRPDDIVIEAVLTADGVQSTTQDEPHDPGRATPGGEAGTTHRKAGPAERVLAMPTRTLDDILAQAGWTGTEIHFLSIDAEAGADGSTAEIIRGLDLQQWRPWVLVIGSGTPNGDGPTQPDWEKTVGAAGYAFRLFDGLSRFYVAPERAADLGGDTWAPANVGDNFTTANERRLARELSEAKTLCDAAIKQSISWRTVALERWSEGMEFAGREADERQRLQMEFMALQQTLSWRVTRPLRAIRGRFPRTREEE
jgi:Methyltransferase FkbM domain